MPRVSVIIPTYNRRELLLEALASVFTQTRLPDEVIVVDDGSTDGSAEAVRARFSAPFEGARPTGPGARADSRPSLRVIRTEHTGMPGAARNRGTEAAAGELIAFLDSDDLWRPEKLERTLERREGGLGGIRPARIVHTRETWLRGGREISQKGQRHRREGDLFGDSLVKCIIGPSTVLLERELLESVGGFREDLEIAEDYELWLRIVSHIPVSYVDEALTAKRAAVPTADGAARVYEQLSEKYGQIEIFRIRALRDLVDSARSSDRFHWKVSAGQLDRARAELARKCSVYAHGARKRGRAAEADDYEALARHYSTFVDGDSGGG